MILKSYTVWKHFGQPFGEGEDQSTNISFDNGWVLHERRIMDSGATWHSHSFSKTYSIESDVDREVWYAVTISDMFSNQNIVANPGSGGNALKVKEDTTKPSASFTLYDGNDDRYSSPSLVSGSYKIIVSVDENLFTMPKMEITTRYRRYYHRWGKADATICR